MSSAAVLLIRLYQKIFSPFFGGSCRFYPSCSDYGIEAIETHGFISGSFLTIKRIFRCNPFCECGFDPVPPADSSKQFSKSAR